MKRLATLALALSTGLTAADYRDVQKSVALNANGAVRVDNHKGSIQVSTWDRPEVEIRARIEAESGSFPWTSTSRRLLDSTEIQIDSSPDSVRIRTKYPESCCSFDSGSTPLVRYTIQMPRTARLTIRDHRSETQITDLQGALDLGTHRGTVRVTGLAGPLAVVTHRGEVAVQFAAYTGHSSVQTHRGTIDLTLPRDARFDLDAQLDERARLDSAFPLVTRSGARRGGKFRGGVNGGGPALRLESHRGDIRLRQK